MINSCKKKETTKPMLINGKCFVNGIQKNVEVDILIRMGNNKSEFAVFVDYLTSIYSPTPEIMSAVGVYRVPKNTEYSQQEPSYPDYPCERYSLVVSDIKNNYTEITKYNPDTKEISGKFGFTFVKTSDNCNRVMPDTIRVTEGTFENVVVFDQNK